MSGEFKVHRLNEAGFEKANRIAASFASLLQDVENVLPQSRILSLVKTKLEEASMWTKRGIAEISDNQAPVEARPEPVEKL